MRAVDIIVKKRDNQELTSNEIKFFIDGYTKGEIPDYQASSLAMAILLNGMNDRETTDLTLSIVSSGRTLDLSEVVPIAVDKHSTGGVGDKTTLVVEPVVAACGLAVGKMSGRGLGFSGGTLDKMESIPGFRTDLNESEFRQQIKDIGLVLTGQSPDLAPADGKLYALRDVTGTVPSMPLIASSVMSKKIAAGAQAIVLDVKTGSGAFMKTVDEARQLATIMVSIGNLSGRKVIALISDMNQPLGKNVGNSLEVIEAINTLQGNGPEDFTEHCMIVGSYMLVLGKKAEELTSARKLVGDALRSGKGLEKFRQLVAAQGGDVSYVDNPDKFPHAKYIETVNVTETGWLAAIDAQIIGETSVELGAGREKKTDKIDHSVGIEVLKKVGEQIKQGEPIFIVHSNNASKLENAKEKLVNALKIKQDKTTSLPLFYDVLQ